MLPFIEEKISEFVVIRTFFANTHWSEFKWHWDEEDRIIKPLNENDWQFQFDNELPQKIYNQIKIQKGVIHRIIPGSTELIIKIFKNNETH